MLGVDLDNDCSIKSMEFSTSLKFMPQHRAINLQYLWSLSSLGYLAMTECGAGSAVSLVWDSSLMFSLFSLVSVLSLCDERGTCKCC